MNTFTPYIKAVGTGPKHNHDLSEQQIQNALTMILTNQVSHEEIGAFLLGWRVKGETIEELKGALKAFDTLIKKVNVPNSIELGYPYDGKVNNPYLFPLIAQYLKPFATNLTLLGDQLQPAKQGITTKEICEEITLADNLYYFERSTIFKELAALGTIRDNLGMRTSLNTVEKLTGFAQSRSAVIGAFHKPFVEKYIEMYRERYDSFAVIKGNEGSFEVFSKCRAWICKEGKVEEIMIDPHHFGITYEKSWQRISLQQSLEAMQNPDSELQKLARLNAALLLLVKEDHYQSLHEAYEAIKE